MRRIVTGHTDDGRSTVVLDEVLSSGGMTPLWTVEPGSVSSRGESVGFEAASGGVAWVSVALPTEPVMRAALAGGVPGVDPDGWHTTPTTDLVMVLDGPVFLALDTGEVELQAGDCVVQQGTRHAWWNRTDGPARIVSVSVSS